MCESERARAGTPELQEWERLTCSASMRTAAVGFSGTAAVPVRLKGLVRYVKVEGGGTFFYTSSANSLNGLFTRNIQSLNGALWDIGTKGGGN